MAKFQRSLTLGVFLLGAALLSAFAAPEPKSAQPPLSISAVWLRGQAPAAAELFVAMGEGTPLPLAVGGSSRGRPVELSAGGPKVRLFVRAPASTAVAGAPTSSPSFVPVGEIGMPSGEARKVLLVLASPKGTPKVLGMALADDEKLFPANTVEVVNFTKAPVLMKQNQTVKSVAAGASDFFPYAVVGDPKAKDVLGFPFALAATDAVFFNGRIDCWPNSRTLVLVSAPAEEGKSPIVQILIDRVALRAPDQGRK